MPVSDPREQREQLRAQRRKVDFDTYDITVDELIRRVSEGRIEIAPSYQRQFRWDVPRQSRLIESVLLGIPVPPLFMATNVEEGSASKWEVVDGLQRLMSLVHFAGTDESRTQVDQEHGGLRLAGLELLDSFNGLRASQLPPDILDGLRDRPMKAIVLNDKSDLQVRYDLFERLNTGGVRLTDQEIREAVFPGPFMNLLNELSASTEFRSVVLLPQTREKDGTRQDYVLRFFAFLDRYQSFEHSVHDFLLEYCRDASLDPRVDEKRRIFNETFRFLAQIFPDGVRRRSQRLTPVNLYEAISVGAALAIARKPDLEVPDRAPDWVTSDDLRSMTTGATNDRRRVSGRIEYCRNRFLEYDVQSS